MFNLVQVSIESNVFKEFRKISFRNLSKFKNKFFLQNDLKEAFDKQKINKNLIHKMVSSDIVSGKESNQIIRSTKKLSLKYKGQILFGIHPVYLALLTQKRIFYQLFIRNENDPKTINENSLRKKEILKIASSLRIPVTEVNTQKLKYLVHGAVHQGFCLDTGPLVLQEWNEEKTQKITEGALPLWLVLDEIIDPMNVGAIIRSAYYFGVDKIFVVKGNSCKLSPVVSKASSGVLEVMDIHQIENLEYFVQVMKSKKWNIISTLAYCEDKINAGQTIDASEYVLKDPTILILGNESRGISTSVHDLCDNFIFIYPFLNLHQGIDSLNVSVATGVILHSLAKSWKSFLNKKF